MKNKDIGCYDVAKSIKDMMTIANFSGFIKQDDGEPFRQFSVSSVNGDEDNATMSFDFADKEFKLNISFDTKGVESQ